MSYQGRDDWETYTSLLDPISASLPLLQKTVCTLVTSSVIFLLLSHFLLTSQEGQFCSGASFLSDLVGLIGFFFVTTSASNTISSIL